MAKKTITSGCTIWTKTGTTSFWLELGKQKAIACCQGQMLGLTFLALIPPPFGPVIVAAVTARHAVFCNNIGSNGTWIKFNLTGPVSSRKRTPSNMQKAPSPW